MSPVAAWTSSGGQPREVGEQRAHDGVVDRVPGQVRLGAAAHQVELLRIGDAEASVADEVDPRAEQHRARRQRELLRPQRQEQRASEPAADRVAREDDSGAVALLDQPAVRAQRVLERRRERMLGRETVVGHQRAHPGRGDQRADQRPVAVGGADGVAAAVQIEDRRLLLARRAQRQRRDTARVDRPHRRRPPAPPTAPGRSRTRCACPGCRDRPLETSSTGAHIVAMRLASSPPTDCVVAIASSRSPSSRRARSSSALPATVSSTRCVERRSSSQPSRRSSARIWRLSAGWERYSRAAARPKLRSSATATNARRWRTSTPSGACGKASTSPVGSLIVSMPRVRDRGDADRARPRCSIGLSLSRARSPASSACRPTRL